MPTPVRYPKPAFATLWSNYRMDHVGYDNECAIRLSRCLIESGWPVDAFQNHPFSSWNGNLTTQGYVRGAQDLAAFLDHAWGSRNMGWAAPGGVPSAAKTMKGIACFMTIPGYSGQGHIDLWNGSHVASDYETSPYDGYWNAQTVWLWSLA